MSIILKQERIEFEKELILFKNYSDVNIKNHQIYFNQ